MYCTGYISPLTSSIDTIWFNSFSENVDSSAINSLYVLLPYTTLKDSPQPQLDVTFGFSSCKIAPAISIL